MRKLLKNNEVWLEHQGYFIKSKRGKGKLTIIEREFVNNKINENSLQEGNIITKHKRSDLTNLLDHSEFKDYND